MARPTNKEVLERANEVSIRKIRARLPDLTDALLEAATKPGKRKVQCGKCKYVNEIEDVPDLKLALELWTRAEGKPVEQKPLGDVDRFAGLMRALVETQKLEEGSSGSPES